MSMRGLKQVDILNKAKPYCEKYEVKLNKSDLSQYVSGKSEPGQDKLAILGMALNVSETWLMGYDVPIERAESIPTPNNLLENIKSFNTVLKKYEACSDKGKEKINAYINNVYNAEQAEKEFDNKETL